MPAATVTARAGYFGKLPQVRDFVSANLPQSFVEPWDAFLRDFLASSRDALGEDWLEAYLNGPIWRFALGEGVAGSEAAAGILMPSVDAVGRYFPLTIVALTERLPVSGEDAWFEDAEGLALETLDDAFDVASLSARVAALGLPSGPVNCAKGCGCWWTMGSRFMAPLAFRAGALPAGPACATLLDGDAERWAFKAEPLVFTPELKEPPRHE